MSVLLKLCLSLFLTCLVVVCVGQTSTAKVYDWKSAGWSGKSSPALAAAKSRIDKLVANVKAREANVKEAEKLARANPTNRAFQFEWLYWAYRVALYTGDDTERPTQASRQAMLRIAPPYDLEYVWLLFIVDATNNRGLIDQPLVDAGRRLLKLIPDSYRVMFQMSRLLMFGSDVNAKRESTKLIDKVIKMDPDYYGNYFTGGMSYEFLHSATKERSAALKSHAYFTKYLTLSKNVPKEKYLRKAAESHLAGLNYILKNKSES